MKVELHCPPHARQQLTDEAFGYQKRVIVGFLSGITWPDS